jgi:hypothetical protein
MTSHVDRFERLSIAIGWVAACDALRKVCERSIAAEPCCPEVEHGNDVLRQLMTACDLMKREIASEVLES